MPYRDPAAKKAYGVEYRKAHSSLLSSKQRARYAAMTPQERAVSVAKQRERQRVRVASGLFDRTASRRYARERHERKKHDPEYRRKAIEKTKKWAQENRDRFNATLRAIKARRYATDINYRLAVALRRRFYMAVKGAARTGTAVRELGCSVVAFKEFIEKQFQPGMSWENWGRHGWHIDHAKPLASFDLTDQEQARAACHYSNLQPLWAIDNIRKAAHL